MENRTARQSTSAYNKPMARPGRTLRWRWPPSRQEPIDLPFLATKGTMPSLCRWSSQSTGDASVLQQEKATTIDGRITRHAGYRINQKIRIWVEEILGWLKTIACPRKTRHRGLEVVAWMFENALAAYSFIHMRNLIWGSKVGKGKIV